jgi:hypothetical protein
MIRGDRDKGVRESWLPVFLALAVLLFGLALIGVGAFAINSAQQVGTQQAAIHEGLVHACEKVGDPLRHAVLSQLRDQKKQTKKLNHADLVNAYRQLLPNTSVRHIDRLIRHQRKSRNRQIQALQSVPPCDARY